MHSSKGANQLSEAIPAVWWITDTLSRLPKKEFQRTNAWKRVKWWVWAEKLRYYPSSTWCFLAQITGWDFWVMKPWNVLGAIWRHQSVNFPHPRLKTERVISETFSKFFPLSDLCPPQGAKHTMWSWEMKATFMAEGKLVQFVIILSVVL